MSIIFKRDGDIHFLSFFFVLQYLYRRFLKNSGINIRRFENLINNDIDQFNVSCWLANGSGFAGEIVAGKGSVGVFMAPCLVSG